MISAVRTTGRWSILKRFRRDRNGTTAVEFGLVAMPFFAILGMIIETGLAFFTGQVLEAATTSAGRIVMTGQVQLTPGPPAIRIARANTENIQVDGHLVIDADQDDLAGISEIELRHLIRVQCTIDDR